jgi:hypothetical protein
MTAIDLGANEFTFEGDRTQITYLTQTPGPIRKGFGGEGELRYQGPEGDATFVGEQITRLDSSLGVLLTVVLRVNSDTGDIKITLLVPRAIGATHTDPVTFSGIAIKTTGRGFIETPGVELTYDVLPLLGQARLVFLPE